MGKFSSPMTKVGVMANKTSSFQAFRLNFRPRDVSLRFILLSVLKFIIPTHTNIEVATFGGSFNFVGSLHSGFDYRVLQP